MAWSVGTIAETLGTMGNASSTASPGSQGLGSPVTRSSAATATCRRPPAETNAPEASRPVGVNLRYPTLPTSPVGTFSPSTRQLLSTSATAKVESSWRVLGENVPTGDVGSVGYLKFTPTGLLASGAFVSAGGRRQVAVAALDRLTGLPRPWDPGLAVDEAFPIVPSVSAIVPTDHAIYLGGYFTHAGGQLRKSL